MPFLVGVVLAVAVGLMATWVGFDRERSFYPVVLIVIAYNYFLFALADGNVEILIAELVPFAIFLIVALLGFKKNLWLVVAGLAGHGIFDLVHVHLIADRGVPVWWPIFCLSYDITAALYLAWRLKRARVPNVSVRAAQSS
jgi:hypothetical protein